VQVKLLKGLNIGIDRIIGAESFMYYKTSSLEVRISLSKIMYNTLPQTLREILVGFALGDLSIVKRGKLGNASYILHNHLFTQNISFTFSHYLSLSVLVLLKL
jgi:hypothetical protein